MTVTIARSMTLVLGLTLLTKVSGFVRVIVIASYFGTSREMDAFFVATAILGFAIAWLDKPIRVVVVPLVTRSLAERGEGAAWQQTSRLLNGALVLFLAVAAVEAGLAPLLVSVVAPGLGQEAAGLAGRLAQFLALALVLDGLARFLMAVSHAHQRFARPGLATAVDNVVIVLAVSVLAPALGIWGLAVATVLGALGWALMQLPLVWAHRQDYRFGLDLGNPTLRRMAWLGLPLMVGTGGAHLVQLTDRFFASLLPAGRLSALAYAQQLTYVPLQLLASSLATVLFPYLTRKADAEDYADLSRKLGRSLSILFIVVLPVSVGIAVLHEPLVRLVYERGAFIDESTRVTADAVLVYALGLPAFTLSVLLSYAFYSVENTKTPVMAGLVRLGFKLLLSLVLIRPLAHVGLALAESLSLCLKTGLLLALLPDKLRGPEYGRVFRSFSVTAVAGAAMALVLLAVLPAVGAVFPMSVSSTAPAEVAVGAAIGGATYLLLSLLFQPIEVRDLYRLVRSGLRRRG